MRPRWMDVFSLVVFFALAAISFWWATDEAERENRLVLQGAGILMLTLAVWRAILIIRTRRAQPR